MTSRRGFILGLTAALAAPAVVRAESLMKVAVLRESVETVVIQTPYLSAEMIDKIVNPPLLLEAEVRYVRAGFFVPTLLVYGNTELVFH